MANELVVGTFVDNNLSKTSSLNGSEVVFVITVEDFNGFVENTCKSNYQDLAILARYKCDEQFADDYLSAIESSKAPHNKKWYYKENLSESIESLERMTNFKPKLYKSKKNDNLKHFKTQSYKTAY